MPKSAKGETNMWSDRVDEVHWGKKDNLSSGVCYLHEGTGN